MFQRRTQPIMLGVLLLLLAQGISVGFRAGAAFSALLFEDPYATMQTLPRPGLEIDVIAVTELTSNLSLEAGLGFVQRGFVDYGAHFGDLKTGHLVVPILLRTRIPWGIPPQFITGLEAGYQISCRVDGVAAFERVPCDDPLAGMPLNKADLGVAIGFGGAIPLDTGAITIDALGTFGLLDRNNGTHVSGYIHDLSIRLIFGYRIPIGGRSGQTQRQP